MTFYSIQICDYNYRRRKNRITKNTKSMTQSFVINKKVIYEITTEMTVRKPLKKNGVPSEVMRGFFF